ncbi:hypothetical protein [Pedobacter sp. Leaf176]|uniref:hypothetical protein n=1 Tax=Pedobacter sp. Leaf176 TaxID=1736286 RepID=UPI0006F6DCBB|nr:hypothetical protein [Pedobacter sp. Leaf176]KQR65329.1 hypothetical protein ASF92_20585 [Pedobacter sp. Leaf176]
MIKINRPLAIPLRLSVEGAAADLQNRNDYDASPGSYTSLIIEFEILNKIYGHVSVKSALRAAQFNKCCFCEKDQVEEDGTVEHFRPKMGFREKRKEALVKPGYYWLGYTWTNLLFCCSKCNGARYKGNLFPLRAGSARARTHNDDLSLEDPYLIDPASIDPRAHIYFDDEMVKYRTDYGQETIHILGLDRTTLNDFRKALIQDLKSRIITIKAHRFCTPAQVAEAKQFLRDAQLPSAKFSAAAIDFIAKAGVALD